MPFALSTNFHPLEVLMFTRGNRKLGGDLIWSFSLPSGVPGPCPGASPACVAHCYARAFERYRTTASEHYRRNLRLSRRRDFARHVRAFLVAHDVRVVRVHVGGDFYSARYVRKWACVITRNPRVRFYLYTRSWRIPDIKTEIDRMAGLPNCRVWYSIDHDTGLPGNVPTGVRLTWLQTAPDDLPPVPVHLVFRVRSLRSAPPSAGEPFVCPAEDGVSRTPRMTCERCGYCWRPPPAGRIPLPMANPHSTEDHDTC